MLAVLAAKICRDEALTEEEKTRRLRAMLYCWEQYKDKKKDLIYYDYVKQAYEGKEVKQRVIDEKELTEFIISVKKECEDFYQPVFNAIGELFE
ncbi:MAG: hypothetical protein HDP34_03450 [Clostridia bacterium]|nr:hypothetical protein [Clostridia bacterium]